MNHDHTRILFLDIDEVLVDDAHRRAAAQQILQSPAAQASLRQPLWSTAGAEILRDYYSRSIASDAVSRVLAISAETGARIVVHSDWAVGVEDTRSILIERGIGEERFHRDWCIGACLRRLRAEGSNINDIHFKWYGATDNRHMRVMRIPAWLNLHADVTSIAILDDASHPAYHWYAKPLYELRFGPSRHPPTCANPQWVRVGRGGGLLNDQEAAKAIRLLRQPYSVLATDHMT
jgi:hypothetical protein